MGLYIQKDKHISEKSFIPWSKENMLPLAFLKRVRDTQTKNSKEFLEAILDFDLKPNFRPKDPCRCPKVVKCQTVNMFKNKK